MQTRPLFLLLCLIYCGSGAERRKRYLVFTESTQAGLFATVAMPLHPETTVSVAWFFEANYYTVANASYLQPLLGDIGEISKRRDNRAADEIKPLLTRRALYKNFESLLEKHGFPSVCLLRAICENASTHFLHNGLLGDVLYLILTPSTSMEEQDLEDYYYEAEYLGLEDECYHYEDDCPDSPLDFISLKIKP